jgi:hypothetical protein
MAGPNIGGQIGAQSAVATQAAAAQGQTSSIPTTTSGPSGTPFKATQGWYIFVGVVVAIALGNTGVGPFALGILGVALIYQISQLVQHR